MDSAGLTSAQLHAIASRLARHRDYLDKLRARMGAVGFPDHDPLATAVRRAADAASVAYGVAPDLEREAAVQAARIPYTKRQGEFMRRRGEIE